MVPSGGSDSPPPPAVDFTAVSKRLSYVLRHDPASAGVHLDPGGWVAIADLLRGLHRGGLPLTKGQLRDLVERSAKRRFAIDASGHRIRANHGHSVDVDLGLTPAEPPDRLFHGTVGRSVPEILRMGLQAGSRQFVHLSDEIEAARTVGARRGKPVVLDVRAARMFALGVADFFRTVNGVWLVDHVPPEFVSIHETPPAPAEHAVPSPQH